MRELEVTSPAEPVAHRLYQVVLTYSHGEWVAICASERFESLSAGLQGALCRLGGVSEKHRTDNLPAATHERPERRGREFTKPYPQLLDRYGLLAPPFRCPPCRKAVSRSELSGALIPLK